MFVGLGWTLEFIGLIGAIAYLGAYAALMAGFIRGDGYAYAAFNLCAALLIMASLQRDFNLSAMVVQVSFAAISLYGLARLYLANRRIRFTAEETALLNALLPDLRSEHQRRFMDHGAWIDGEPGMTLTEEGKPVGTLYFLMSGEAEVRVDTRIVATIDGGFVGEIGALREGPASASVNLTRPARLFAISSAALRRLRDSASEIRGALDSRMTEDTARKLMASNARGAGASEI
ncbi:CBU_0592 family membrane protein [Anianabacter salinae]|uniref:CBU_0592 family membrane protein n=1 Tax=Anianabacter salinae TaxID=2851023 RepID=UPI00225E4679|nr:cyclic nucleotide-binding domain-containing protein [Anianabacter salinae]MBV0911774.1 cyclic nucleotide-binding domain-containing protein [Anianabacter salinae]